MLLTFNKGCVRWKVWKATSVCGVGRTSGGAEPPAFVPYSAAVVHVSANEDERDQQRGYVFVTWVRYAPQKNRFFAIPQTKHSYNHQRQPLSVRSGRSLYVGNTRVGKGFTLLSLRTLSKNCFNPDVKSVETSLSVVCGNPESSLSIYMNKANSAT